MKFGDGFLDFHQDHQIVVNLSKGQLPDFEISALKRIKKCGIFHTTLTLLV